MVDEFFERHYQAGRDDLNAAILDLGRRCAKAFRTLNRIQYHSPWAAKHEHPRTH